MNKISQKQINDAAKLHSEYILGTSCKTNPEASKAIQDVFKAGIKWVFKTLKQKP